VLAGENSIQVENSRAIGGLSTFVSSHGTYSGCNNAAAGTVYQTTEDRLVIDNGDHMSTKLTRVNVPAPEGSAPARREPEEAVETHSSDGPQGGSFFGPIRAPGFDSDLAPRGRPQIVAAALEITGQANALILDAGSWLEFGDMSMDSDTTLVLGSRQEHMTLNFGRSARLSTESTLDFSQAKVLVFNATVEDDTAVGTILMRHTLVVNANRLVVGGRIGLPDHAPKSVMEGTTVALRASENIYFRGSASLEAGLIWVHANSTISSGDGFNATST
jgi:hypothetical protein